MPNKKQFLILQSSGSGGCLPEPLDWFTEQNTKVVILNNSGAEQTLSNISDQLLKTSGGWVGEITIADGNFWEGKVGNQRPPGNPGRYMFEDGTKEGVPREGTIDPS